MGTSSLPLNVYQKKELKGFLVGSRHKFHLGRQAFTSHGSCTSLVCNHLSEGFTPTDLLYGITRARFFNLAMLERKILSCSTWHFIIYGYDFYSLREGAGSHWWVALRHVYHVLGVCNLLCRYPCAQSYWHRWSLVLPSRSKLSKSIFLSGQRTLRSFQESK